MKEYYKGYEIVVEDNEIWVNDVVTLSGLWLTELLHRRFENEEGALILAKSFIDGVSNQIFVSLALGQQTRFSNEEHDENCEHHAKQEIESNWVRCVLKF